MILFLALLFYSSIPQGDQDTAAVCDYLNQPYTYLGEGAQMRAYVSEDGLYVLKLFKAKHTPSFKWKRLWKTGAQKKRSQEKWDQKFAATCLCYERAFSSLKDETGLLYLHFEKTNNPLPLTLKDKSVTVVDLATLPFVLQKKALLAPDYFKQNPHLKEKGKEALKAFFEKRLAKGFSDPRQTLSKNYGFIGDEPVQIDPGKIEPFTKDPKAEIEKIHAHVEEWVSRF